jgi:hypothetical protein
LKQKAVILSFEKHLLSIFYITEIVPDIGDYRHEQNILGFHSFGLAF